MILFDHVVRRHIDAVAVSVCEDDNRPRKEFEIDLMSASMNCFRSKKRQSFESSDVVISVSDQIRPRNGS